MTTVKELERRLKVSRVSIYSQIKKPEFKGHTFKDVNGITQIDDVGQAMLEARYLQGQSETIQDIVSDELINEDLINNKGKAVRTEVKSKNGKLLMLLQSQLATKDEQITHLLRIVSNQQQIHVTHLLKNEHHTPADGEVLISPEKRNPWYRRIFNRA
jgi:hypothetical protein